MFRGKVVLGGISVITPKVSREDKHIDHQILLSGYGNKAIRNISPEDSYPPAWCNKNKK